MKVSEVRQILVKILYLALAKQYQTRSTARLIAPSMQVHGSIKTIRPAVVSMTDLAEPEEPPKEVKGKATPKVKAKGKAKPEPEPVLEEPEKPDNPNRTRGILTLKLM